jgi:hypothetical protein
MSRSCRSRLSAISSSPVSARRADIDALQAALEKAGVEFIDGDRPGVRFRK